MDQKKDDKMSQSEKFSQLKKEIRSILISFQKGCYLSEFNRTFKSLIGKRLPVTEFSFRSDVELLDAMPDVVRITSYRSGEPHLQGIADEKSVHIQKMVCRQKPAKLKPPSRSRFSHFYENYSAPPRFNETPKFPQFSKKIPTSFQFSDAKSKPFQSMSNLSQNSKPKPSSNISQAALTTAQSKPTLEIKPTSPQAEVISLVKHYKNGIPLTEILYEYEQMYKKSFSLSMYGFSSIEECIENISELDIVDIDDIPFAVHESESSKLCERGSGVSTLSSSANGIHNDVGNSTEVTSAALPKSNSNYSRSSNSINRKTMPNNSIMSKLEEVAKKYPKGVWASEFPGYFEEVSLTTLDLHNLGYNCLADFIDEVPEIFLRKPVTGNKKDYFIYPASLKLNDSRENADLPEMGVLLVEDVITKLRQILQGNPEGIKMEYIEQAYMINCNGRLCASDLGFRDLETFLLSVKERVPLRIETLNGVKMIHLMKLSDMDIELPYSSPQACNDEAIPFDAVFPDFEFKQLVLPKDFNFTQFIPVYVSSVINPAHLYIQFQGDKTAKAFGRLADDLEDFYYGENSNLYRMKNVHIQVGASCIALWPSDQHWYRAQILSIPSMSKVLVHYIDYGTRDIIPKTLLRYIKKDYTKLPIQALRCCLSYLKPPKNSTAWSPRSRQRLLNMVTDTSLMAKIEEIKPNGIYSILLCDTNGEKDVYFNDELIKEELAECGVDEPAKTTPSSPEPPVNVIPEPILPTQYHRMDPIQALQAQYYLHVFATVAPSFAQNENYLKLLQQISMLCPVNHSTPQNISLPYNPSLVSTNSTQFSTGINAVTNSNQFSTGMSAVTNSNQLLTGMNTVTNSNLDATYPSGLLIQGGGNPLYASSPYSQNNGIPAVTMPDIITPPIRAPTPTDVLSIAKAAAHPIVETNSDIFEDDDDGFEEFCQKTLSGKTRRFVKRVMLDDGYKIHIILVQSKPYVSRGDISYLIWNNKDPDFLHQKLQQKEVDYPTLNVSEDSNEELFYQLKRCSVKGVQATSGFKGSILLYPLKVVIKILNLFGHPSISLRTKLTEEIRNFNINDPVWKEFSAPEVESVEHKKDHEGETDDEKINRLCLFDLHAMKEGLHFKKLQIINESNHSDTGKFVEEISKLEKLHQQVLERIVEINDICALFA